MGRNINSAKLSKTLILSKVSQISIFSVYFNIKPEVIQHCIDTGELICSPIRDDNHPTCGFRYDNRGKLKFKDFAGYFWGDAFDAVALIINNIYNKTYNVNNKQDFIKILRHISITFKDIFYGQDKDINLINSINTSLLNIKKRKSNIELVVREWDKTDELYWNKIGVSIQYLNTHFVYPIEQYYIDRKVNPEPKYFYNSKDPCYAYLLGKDKTGICNIKLYFPKRSKEITRFITNCNHLEGIYNLDGNKYDIIVITKSTKDRLSIGATIKSIVPSTGGLQQSIGVINIPHETYKLRQNEYDWLCDKLSNNGKLVSLMDNDNVGMCEANWLRRNYHIIPIIIPYEYNSKDFAELVTNNNFEVVKCLITDAINYIINYERKNNKLIWDTKTGNTLPY